LGALRKRSLSPFKRLSRRPGGVCNWHRSGHAW